MSERSEKRALPKKYKFVVAEKFWQERWAEWGVFRWDPSRPLEETFVVDSPPPTVSGSLHIGHVFSYAHQDFIVRYQRMRGRNIFYPMGWDDNGLPTERRVQNRFGVRCDTHTPYVDGLIGDEDAKGLKKKLKSVRSLSRANFIELCHKATAEDEQVFKDLWQHLGLSIDWEQEYATIDDHSRRISQRSFLRLLADGHAYQQTTPAMWDIQFQTAVAQAEVEDRSTPGAFHNVRFGTADGEHLVVATTRPEFVPACVAVVAHPDDERYKHLFGKKAVTPLFGVEVPILPSEVADPEKGTGILMVCTFGDQTDVDWWREFKLPLRQVIGRNGRLEPVTFGEPGWESRQPERANRFYAELEGLRILDAREKIVELLRDPAGGAVDDVAPLVGEPEPIEHAVKYYEKGDLPLELVPTRQWFIRLLDKKEALLEQGRKIQWHPSYMRTRYDHWVEGLAMDWCVSRQRYFGVPIPLWYPIDAEGNVVFGEPIAPKMEALPIDPQMDVPPGYDASQRGVPGGFAGEDDVLDTWATSSMTPEIASHWELDPERHAKLFPMDIRPQSHEIIRTWAFYTIAKAYLHEGEIPWKNVVISGWILDPDRKKMSKSRGNVVTPEPLLVEHSTDAVRYWAAGARLGADYTFDGDVIGNGRRLVTKLLNASKFILGRVEVVDADDIGPERITQDIDRDFIVRLREVVTGATEAFERFEFAEALAVIEPFFWRDLCDNYLELVKTRAYREELDDGRRSGLATLRATLKVVLRLFAPVVPIITEEVWAASFGEATAETCISVAAWPTVEELAAVAEPETAGAFDAAVAVLGEIRRAKTFAQKSIKWPVDLLTVEAPAADLDRLRVALDDVIAAGTISRTKLVDGQAGEESPFQVGVELSAERGDR